MRYYIKALIFAFAAVFAINVSAHAADTIYTARFSNLALDGYDAVAYFSLGAPVKGAAEFSTEYEGAQWRFSSAENLAAFQENPLAYAPKYGGYCAWALSQNKLARGNPQNWNIVDGKLYMNYDDKIQARWAKDIPGFIALADQYWPDILD